MPPDAVLAQSPRDPGQHRECMSGVWHILCSLPSVATCGFDSRLSQSHHEEESNGNRSAGDRWPHRQRQS
jgi:hypothetical protein